MTTEITGLDQSIGYAQHLAAQAALHGPDGNEGYLARLAGCRVTGDGLRTGRAMQEAFAAAAGAAAAHARELTRQKSVQEQYDVNPDAGDKTYLTSADDTGPVPAADATAGAGPAAGGPAVRSERDVLARGAHIGVSSSPRWQRHHAREWDAGRVSPAQRAVAYAHADAVLADRARIAAGPGAERMKAMRRDGIVRCPSWCPQHADEHEHEAHIGPDRTLITEDGVRMSMRPRVSWWDNIEPTVELAVTAPAGADGRLVLTAADLERWQRLTREVLGEAVAQHHDDVLATGKPAYPGAYCETIDTGYDVDAPAAAAAALDLRARASGYYLTHDSDDDSGSSGDEGTGAYLDWSTQPEPGVRHVEVGDGADAVCLPLTTSELEQLRDGIGRLAGAVDDGVEDPGQLVLDDATDDAYIDWSVTEDGLRLIEFGDGDDAVQLALTDAQLREFHERLALQLRLDAHDGDR